MSNKIIKGKNVFIADTAKVIGTVELGDHASVWFGSVIRGDNDKITIGKNTNIQDGCIIHVDDGVPVHIGDGVTIGHGAIIHGATIETNSLIGIRATLLNRVKIGKNCIIGAHSLVTTGQEIPDNSLVMGSPAKVIRTLTSKEIEGIKLNVAGYVNKGMEYLSGKYKS